MLNKLIELNQSEIDENKKNIAENRSLIEEKKKKKRKGSEKQES
jgi:hypothetical protein